MSIKLIAILSLATLIAPPVGNNNLLIATENTATIDTSTLQFQEFSDSNLSESDSLEVKAGNSSQDDQGQVQSTAKHSITNSIFSSIKNSVNDILINYGIIGIILLILGVLCKAGWDYYIKVYVSDKRDAKSNISQSFDLPEDWKIKKGTEDSENEIKEAFYLGKPTPNPPVYICRELDGNKYEVRHKIKTISNKIDINIENKFHIPIYGDRLQGKTCFMARLAYNLACIGIYHVLWCKSATNTPFRKSLKIRDFTLIKEYLKNYQKYCVPRRISIFPRKKKLIVVIDDFLQYDDKEQFDTFYPEQYNYDNFIFDLNSSQIFIVTASSWNWKCMGSSHEPVKLELEKEDKVCIANNLIKHRFIEPGDIDEICNIEIRENQLLDFLYLLLPKHHGFQNIIDKFEVNDNEIFNILGISEALDVKLPEKYLKERYDENIKRLKHEGLAEAISDGSETYLISKAGPVLVRLFFEKRSESERISVKDLLKNTLLNIFKIIKNDTENDKYFPIMRLFLKQLANNRHFPVIVIPGIGLSREIFEKHEEDIEKYLNDVDDASILEVWAALMNKLEYVEMAKKFYLRALDKIELPTEAPTAVNMKTPVSLAMGLAGVPDKSFIEEQSVPLFRRILEIFNYYNTVEKAPWMVQKVTHKLVDTLSNLGLHQKALDEINKLPENWFDALLFQKKGVILENLGKLSEAKDFLERSKDTAYAKIGSAPKTYLHCLQHYADFLSKNHSKLEGRGESCEDPESYFQEAANFCISNSKDMGIEEYAAVMNAWAKHKEKRENLLSAKEIYEKCIKYYIDKYGDDNIVPARTRNDYANLLKKIGMKVSKKGGEASKWYVEAEEQCRKVIDNQETEEIDQKSWRISHHILGGLVGLSTYTNKNGEKRPNFSEALNILEKSFESSTEIRNNDDEKTWQDVLTHRNLKDVYYKALSDNYQHQVDKRTLKENADFHFQRAFLGLPKDKDNLNTDDVKVHALETQAHYAGFLWETMHDPVIAEEHYLVKAEEHYKKAIKEFEKLRYKGLDWPEAYILYKYYATFLYGTKKTSTTRIVYLQLKALNLIPKSEGMHKERSKVIEYIYQNMCYILGDEYKILEFIRDTKMVSQVLDILFERWASGPKFEYDKLDDLLEVADTLLNEIEHGDEILNKLFKNINSKAQNSHEAEYCLVKVCDDRKGDTGRVQFGKLTEMLYSKFNI